MPHYFQSWRRILGVMTLVMACVFAVGWVRSLTVNESINLSSDNFTLHTIYSGESILSWETWRSDTEFDPEGFPNFYETHNILTRNPPPYEHEIRFFGFRFAEDRVSLDTRIWEIPYWSIVLPLTLLSAWLLLSKPRRKLISN